MASLEQTANNFCIAPWISIFYQNDKAGVCCVSKDSLPMSPDEFRSSDYIKQIRKDFLDGKKPDNCKNCWIVESRGQKSTRSYFTNRKTWGDILDIKFDENTELDVMKIETRASNLCNFKCRMCNPDSSVEIQRELDKFKELRPFFLTKKDTVSNEICDEHWSQLLKMMNTTRQLILTGGEPMLIKRYYDLLDYLVESGLSKTLNVHVNTNSSVYNPKFIDRFQSFESFSLHASIDAVGRTAEYQRHGTIWEKVRSNVLEFAAIPNIEFYIHTAHSAYTILDVEALTDFYYQVYAINPNTIYTIHNVVNPAPLNYLNLNNDLRQIAIKQITSSLKKLNLAEGKFNRVKPELQSMLSNLMITDNCKDFDKFVNMTRALDKARNERFEDVFGYKLY
jgi:sulfatase maturation enzyme AslB (radical SAM superfamily)